MEPADDTPAEISFTWRRLYAFLMLILTAIAVGFIIARLTDSDALKWIAFALIGENVIVVAMYMAGSSMVDWSKLAASWKGRAE